MNLERSNNSVLQILKGFYKAIPAKNYINTHYEKHKNYFKRLAITINLLKRTKNKKEIEKIKGNFGLSFPSSFTNLQRAIILKNRSQTAAQYSHPQQRGASKKNNIPHFISSQYVNNRKFTNLIERMFYFINLYTDYSKNLNPIYNKNNINNEPHKYIYRAKTFAFIFSLINNPQDNITLINNNNLSTQILKITDVDKVDESVKRLFDDLIEVRNTSMLEKSKTETITSKMFLENFITRYESYRSSNLWLFKDLQTEYNNFEKYCLATFNTDASYFYYKVIRCARENENLASENKFNIVNNSNSNNTINSSGILTIKTTEFNKWSGMLTTVATDYKEYSNPMKLGLKHDSPYDHDPVSAELLREIIKLMYNFISTPGSFVIPYIHHNSNFYRILYINLNINKLSEIRDGCTSESCRQGLDACLPRTLIQIPDGLSSLQGSVNRKKFYEGVQAIIHGVFSHIKTAPSNVLGTKKLNTKVGRINWTGMNRSNISKLQRISEYIETSVNLPIRKEFESKGYIQNVLKVNEKGQHSAKNNQKIQSLADYFQQPFNQVTEISWKDKCINKIIYLTQPQA